MHSVRAPYAQRLRNESQIHNLWEDVQLEVETEERKQMPAGMPPRRQVQRRESQHVHVQQGASGSGPDALHMQLLEWGRLQTPLSSSRPDTKARPPLSPPPQTPLTTARSSAEQRALRSGRSATPRTPLSTTRVEDLPWNQPKVPESKDVSPFGTMFTSLTGWLGEAFSGQKKPVKKKKVGVKEDDRPPWDSLTKRAPLTGPTGPMAVANHRAILRGPCEQATDHGKRVGPQQLPRPNSLDAGEVKPTHRVRQSPSGRTHPSKERRHDVREAEIMNSISYFDGAQFSGGGGGGVGGKLLGIPENANDQLGGYITKDASRFMGSSGWIPAQAWAEALRFYPSKEEAVDNGDSYIALSGKTHSVSQVPEEHLEADVRTRNGVAAADPPWSSDQLHLTWAPNMIPHHLKRKLDNTVHKLLTATAPPAPRRASATQEVRL